MSSRLRAPSRSDGKAIAQRRYRQQASGGSISPVKEAGHVHVRGPPPRHQTRTTQKSFEKNLSAAYHLPITQRTAAIDCSLISAHKLTGSSQSDGGAAPRGPNTSRTQHFIWPIPITGQRRLLTADNCRNNGSI